MSFFVSATIAMVLTAPSAVQAQVRLEGIVGGGTSGQVAEDGIATPTLTGKLKINVQPVTAKLKPAPELGLAVVFPFKPGSSAIVSGTWSPTALRATEGGTSRDVQNVSLIQGMLAVRSQIGSLIEAGAGIGAAYMASEDRALLRGGSQFSPVLQGTLGAGQDMGEHRLHAAALVQMQRFGSQAISDADATAGYVMRYGLRVSMTWKGASR